MSGGRPAQLIGGMMDGYSGYAILELMGHKRLAGYVREEKLFGKPLIAVDVEVDGKVVTQFYAPDALYCLTPTTAEMVKAVQSRMNDPAPVHSWELPALAALEPEPDLEFVDDEDIPL